MDISIEKLRIAYEMAKVRKRNTDGKAYTDKDVAREFLTQNSSMISKVISGKAKSEIVRSKLIAFVRSVDPRLLS